MTNPAADPPVLPRPVEYRAAPSDAPLGDESAVLLRIAVEATGIGIYDYDLITGVLSWDARTRAMFGVARDGPVTYEGTFLPSLHPDQRERMDRDLRAALDPDGPGLFAAEYRTIGTALAPARWLAARGQRVVEDGRAIRIIGTVRDITEAKSAEIALRATEERYRLLARATNDAIWDWDLTNDTVVWNEALASAYGWTPDRVGPDGAWWLAQVHPDDRSAVEADIRAVIGGTAEDWRHEYRFRRADGRYADVLDRGYMVRDPSGVPVRMIGAMLDQTERNRAGAQFRAVFQGANIGMVQFDPATVRAMAVNAKLCEIWGASEEDILGHSLARWTPPEDDAEREELHARLAHGEAMQVRLEKRYRRKDGRIIWARVNLVSQNVGGSVHATAMIEDITEERLADARREALIELGDTLRDLQSTADVAVVTARTLGRILGVTRAGYALVDAAGALSAIAPDWTVDGVATTDFAHPLATVAMSVDRLRHNETIAVADVTATPERVEDAASYVALGMRAVMKVPILQRSRLVGILYVLDRAPRDWMPGEIAFAREVAERAWSGLTRLEADEQQSLLNRELSHRLKNTLAMVQAIASQTLRNVTDIEAAKEALAARLIALGKAHDILLVGERESAQIEAVLGSALALHDDRQPGRFSLTGPSITVGSRAALSLALMVHELATNAAKYGALSVPAGRVAIAWTVAPGEAGPQVNMTWCETGGPPVTRPSRKGFGSRLIERGLVGAVGGAVSLDFVASGLVCRITAPLAGFQAAP